MGDATLTPGVLLNGAMTPATPESVAIGTPIPIVATPAAGYVFSLWVASPAANASFDDAANASANVTLSGDATITPSFTRADIAAFMAFFDRGQFSYGTAVPAVRPKDIAQAIGEASAVFNPDLYPPESPQIGQHALLYLQAHFLTTDLDAADSGGQTRLLQNSRSADGLSESLEISPWMNAGEFAFYATTYYGQKFLILSKPYLDGAVFAVHGGPHF